MKLNLCPLTTRWMVLSTMVPHVWDWANFNGFFLPCKEISPWVIYYIIDILFHKSIYIVINDSGDSGDSGDWHPVG